MHPKPQLVLVGNFGAGNFGDELILAGFLQRLKNPKFCLQLNSACAPAKLPKLTQAQITILAAKPILAEAIHPDQNLNFVPQLPAGLRSLSRWNWFSTYRAFRKANVIIFPGGGLFTDFESWHAILIWSLPVLLAKILGKPICFYGQSVGPVHSTLAQKILRKILPWGNLWEVRDKQSVTELQKLKVPMQKIVCAQDSALHLITQNIPKSPKYPKSPRKILLALRNFPQASSQFWAELAQVLRFLAQQQIQFTFVNFGQGDLEFLQEFWQKQKLNLAPKFFTLPCTLPEFFSKLRSFDLVLGIRLHSLISARLVGVPSVGFAYAPKVLAYADKVFLPQNFRAQDFQNWYQQEFLLK